MPPDRPGVVAIFSKNVLVVPGRRLVTAWKWSSAVNHTDKLNLNVVKPRAVRNGDLDLAGKLI